MMKLKLHIIREGNAMDVTDLIQNITWAGAYNQVGRTLDFSLAVSEIDKNLPKISCDLGAGVRFYAGEQLLFDGFVFSRQRDTAGDLLEIGCADRGIYLKRNQAVYQFRNSTPEDIAARVCADFNIAAGSLAKTGVNISRSFPGVSLYGIIQTAYTLAAEQTGKRYMIRFAGEKLEVVEKARRDSTLMLGPKSNLIGATVTESIENLTNQVAIYDKNDTLITTQKNQDLIDAYGLMQAYLRQDEGQDSAAQARKILEDDGPSQKITVTNLGNTGLIAGESVILREPVTGQYGLFWIDSDSHTWSGGLYQNKLVLNFRNMMDEQEAGGKPTA